MSTIDVIFLFMFLPAVLITSALKPKWRKCALLLLSCFFYACGSPAFFGFFAAAVVINVFLAHLLQKLKRNSCLAVYVLALGIILNMGGYFIISIIIL